MTDGRSGYCEVAPALGWAADVRCGWEAWSGARPAAPTRVLPDAMVDVVWDGDRLIVAGPDTHAVVVERRPGDHLVGVRLRPGHVRCVLGVPADSLRDRRVPLADIWAAGAVRELEATLALRPSAAVRLLAAALVRRAPGPQDPLVDAAVEWLRRPPAGLRSEPAVLALTARLGVPERRLRRRLVGAVGYGPMTLARVYRFQRARRHAPASTSLADLAQLAGYADQSHLTRECRRLAGVTPSVLFKIASERSG